MKEKVIKFRAWHKYYKTYYKVTAIDFYSKTLTLSDYTFGDFWHKVPFADVILEQYTMENDKNNVEIYEGSLVKFRDGIYYIKWTSDGYWLSGGGVFSGKSLRTTANVLLEVVGNIHENRDLLG